MTADRPTTTALSCIIERGEREVLICLPHRPEDAPRIWEFPTGLKQVRESHEAGMRRICRQHVGLNIAIHTGQPPIIGDYNGHPAIHRFFIASIVSGEGEPREYRDVRWVMAGQLCEYDYAKVTRDVVEWYVG